jgi:hypothetical protein
VSWRVAKSLDVLLGQLNSTYPQRSKASDGSIGDAAHATRDSDHNPWYGPGIVTARDFTHDPANGVDINRLTDELVATRDRRIKYVIANKLILDSRPGNNPWRWMPYSGSNPHTKHFHLSVVASPLCDDTALWQLPSLLPPPPAATRSVLSVGDSGPQVAELQRVLAAWYPNLGLVVDGRYGPATEAAVKYFQARAGLGIDGIAGPKTLAKLGM